jgi:hypothetical protein
VDVHALYANFVQFSRENGPLLSVGTVLNRLHYIMRNCMPPPYSSHTGGGDGGDAAAQG